MVAHSIVSNFQYPEAARLFAAQTLRTKIVYDLFQLPDESRLDLKNSLLQLIVLNKNGARHINIQLALSLANLAVLFLNWKNVIQELVSTLGASSDTIPSLLEFLKVLPEEMSTNRRLPLTDDELDSRAVELLKNNAEDVMTLLVNYAQLSEFASQKSLVFQCLDSWLAEIDPPKVVDSPILGLVFQALSDPDTFEPASNCICTMISETREVDDSLAMIDALYPQVVALRPLIKESKDDFDTFRALTLIFSEAGESWHMLAARSPKIFRPLVEGVAECTAYDEDLDVVQYTFNFWYYLAEAISLDKYDEARNDFGDIYLGLLKVFISHLQYPIIAGNNNVSSGKELFNDNHENDEKFRAFRHQMGDILKDCCKVVGDSRALEIPYEHIVQALEAQARGENVSWQVVEASLFAIRCMGRMISNYEEELMPQIMKLIERLPENDMVRYTATLLLGRYSEWSRKHPEFLELQINYITSGFSSKNPEVVNSAAQAFRELCYDCGNLLVHYVDQIYPFYEQLGNTLSLRSYYNVTYGIAGVISAQRSPDIALSLKRFGEPICQRLIELSRLTPERSLYRTIADQMELLVIFVREVTVETPIGTADPVAKFVQEVLPVLSGLVEKYGSESIEISERYCKFIRSAVLNLRTHLLEIVPSLANQIAIKFNETHYGCYMWVSGAIIREYSIDELPESVIDTIWTFSKQLMETFITIYSSEIAPNFRQHPDKIEDFFFMMQDVLLCYPFRLITSPQLEAVYEIAKSGLDLFEIDPVSTVSSFLTDLFAYGTNYYPHTGGHNVPNNVRQMVVELAHQRGGELFQKIIVGFITTLPREADHAVSGLMIKILQLVQPAQATSWLATTLDSLPVNSVSTGEKNKLLQSFTTSLMSGNMKKARMQINDFVGWYRRRVENRRGDTAPGSSGSTSSISASTFSSNSASSNSRF